MAGASSQAAARESLVQLRTKASSLRDGLAPMTARALSRVVRSAEHASGRVIEKKARMQELQRRWHDLMVCLRLGRD